MSTAPTAPAWQWILERLKRAEDFHGGDLSIRIYTDGSAHVVTIFNDRAVATFDNIDQLTEWLWKYEPRPKLFNRPHMTNACVGGFHKQCIQGPGQPCNCICHQKAGGNAA